MLAVIWQRNLHGRPASVGRCVPGCFLSYGHVCRLKLVALLKSEWVKRHEG